MKGYELYSWQVGSTWTFALVLGTNRIKSFDELVAPPGEERGLEWLKEELERLPRGESVFWTAGRVPGTILPPEAVIHAVQSHCARLGLDLHLLEGQPTDGEGSGASFHVWTLVSWVHRALRQRAQAQYLIFY